MTNPIASLARRFNRNERGNIAIMTAVSAVVLLGTAGLALDYIRGESLQTDVADASDAIALILARSDAKTEGEMRAVADAYIANHFTSAEAERLSIASIKRDGDAVSVVLKNNYDTSLTKVFNRDDVDVSAGSTAIFSQKNMDVALVLDTTESMRGAKMDALKAAAGDMVTTIDGYKNSNVRMSVVPYTNYVNVGLSRRNAPWLDVPADSSETKNVCRDVREVISRSNCKNVTKTREVDGQIKSYKAKVCDTKYSEPKRVCGDKEIKKTWNGCVGTRNEPFDQRPAFAGKKIPGLLNARCGTEIQPMTTRLSSVKSTIDALEPYGNTYMPSGLVWGWRTLDSQQPLAVKAKKAEKVLILMTDGQNSRNKNGAWHEQKGQKTQADNKTRALCEAIKRDNVTIYTIAYEVDSGSTKTLLSNCASTRSNYFDARNAQDLTKAFKEIGESLNELRITA